MKKLFSVLVLLFSLQCFAQTANDFSSYKEYKGAYSFGLNPGFYYGWTTQNTCKLGNDIGSRNYRMLLYDNLLSMYGYDVFLPDYQYLASLGIKDMACMLGGVSDANAWNPFNQTTTYQGVTYQQAFMWKGMYEPIWINGAVNPSNTYAAYVKKTIDIYGKYIKFWEIINEPDFSYSSGGWLADADPTNTTTWFYVDPKPEELVNIRASIHYYIRLLRISWEVIKKYQPDSYVCTGGLGNRSFLASILRNTDNPVDGAVTSEYPLKGGAYFDVISFHDYPEFSTLTRWWDNNCGCVKQLRNSDNLVAGHLLIKRWMDSIARLNGYDGSRMPIKQFICTETGCSRDSIESFGGVLPQLNYMIKTQVKTLMDGQIKQMFWYATGDGDNNAQDHWSLFGLYYTLTGKTFATAQLTPQGQAFKTTTSLLTGKVYDSVKTKSLIIPAGADGGAFKGGDGKYVFVLWAKTTTDLSEAAAATISLPQCKRTEWNGSTSTLSGNIALTSTPSFFEPVNIALPVKDPVVYVPPASAPVYYNVQVYDAIGRLLTKKEHIIPAQFKAQLPRGKYFILKFYNAKDNYAEKIFKP